MLYRNRSFSVCLRCRLDAGYKGRELYQCSFSKSPDVFVENAINCPQMDDSNYVYYYSRLMLNPKKNLVWLGSKYNKNSYEFVSYMMFEKKENSFEEVETNWSDILNKTMKNRSGYIYDSWYASDESLYVVIMETSMNPLIYNANQENIKAV